MTLSTSARRRGLNALLAISFLMFCGFFMVIPLVSVHYVNDLGFAAVTVGAALALRQLLQQGITVLGGMLADRFGVRGLIGLGVLIRAVGFVFLAFALTPAALFVAMVLSALGGALFEAPSRAALAALAPEEERARYYSLNSVVGGLGMTIGPVLGALLLRLNFQAVCLAAAICFLLVLGAVLLLPAVRVAEGGDSIFSGVGMAVRDRTFVIFTALLMGYWFMWVQLTISLPLVAERLLGSSDGVLWVSSLHAGMTVLLQYPVMRLVERRLSLMPTLIIGMALMAFGIGAVAMAGSFFALLVSVIVFTLGILLAAPTQQSLTAALADPRALGSYFGINALALAFGGSLGNLSGGLLTDAAQAAGMPALPWLTFALVGLGSAIGLAMLGERLRAQRATAHLAAPKRRASAATRLLLVGQDAGRRPASKEHSDA
jgi:DHA1 family multidrug resistance protein-like MFS transporter